MRIIAEVVDSLMDLMPAADELPDRDVFDVMRNQRMATIRQRWDDCADYVAEKRLRVCFGDTCVRHPNESEEQLRAHFVPELNRSPLLPFNFKAQNPC
jgi:hypothetical protein